MSEGPWYKPSPCFSGAPCDDRGSGVHTTGTLNPNVKGCRLIARDLGSRRVSSPKHGDPYKEAECRELALKQYPCMGPTLSPERGLELELK